MSNGFRFGQVLDEFFYDEFPCKDINDAKKWNCGDATTYPKGNPSCFVNKAVWELKVSGLKRGCPRTDNSCTGTLHQTVSGTCANTHWNLSLACSVTHPFSMILIGCCYFKLNA